MILALGTALEDAQGAVRIEGGFGDQLQHGCLAEVVGAGAGNEDASRLEKAEGAEVDFLIGADGRFEAAFILREGRGVKHDYGELAAGAGVAGEEIEDIGLLPLDIGDAIGGAVGARGEERGGGGIDGFHALAFGGEVEGEAAGGGKTIERFAAAGIVGGGLVVLALVEKDSGLLSVEQVGAEGQTVHARR